MQQQQKRERNKKQQSYDFTPAATDYTFMLQKVVVVYGMPWCGYGMPRVQ